MKPKGNAFDPSRQQGLYITASSLLGQPSFHHGRMQLARHDRIDANSVGCMLNRNHLDN
jgi:hypothetical protein